MDVRNRAIAMAGPVVGLVLCLPMVALGASPGTALPQGSDAVVLDPADFGGPIDNPYWPMTPGSKWVFRESDGGETSDVAITVTDRTKQILGIDAVEVHDILTLDGVVVEDTLDWYAQDTSGNLWYMGEDTREYAEDGSVDTAGSWLAGVDGAQPGIAVPGDPQIGLTYRQEYLKGEAEDAARVLSLDEIVEVPAGSWSNVLLTHDFTAIKPDVLEYKLYAKGVGPVLALGISGGSARGRLWRGHRQRHRDRGLSVAVRAERADQVGHG